MTPMTAFERTMDANWTRAAALHQSGILEVESQFLAHLHQLVDVLGK